jgi:hypothetical protein
MTRDRRCATLLVAPAIAIFLAAAGCSSASDEGPRNAATVQCRTSTTTAVGWTDATAMGVPETLFAPFAGTCQAPFAWDGSGYAGAVAIEPLHGQSTLTATAAVDPSSARLVTQTPATCPSLLQADGTITLALPEGNVANQQPFTVSASAGMVPTSLSFTLPEASFGPWVSIKKADPGSSVSQSIQVTALSRACSGRVILGWQKVQDGIGTGMGGPLAAWSDTGCDVGQSGVSLAVPWQGVDLAAAIAAGFGQVTLAGTWEDGSATTLALVTSVPGTVACTDTPSNGMTVATIPVDIVATTADGRVRGLTGRGDVRASVNQGSLWELQLSFSTNLLCASATDTLAYAGADCATDKEVIPQLIFRRSAIKPVSDGGSLEFYVYQRQSTSDGAADRMDRLVFAP